MNVLESIMSDICLQIHPEILDMLINNDTYDGDGKPTLQKYISENIIDRFVLPSLNANCGLVKNIELKNEYIIRNIEKKYDEKITFYSIPMDVSERPIVACRSVTDLDTEFDILHHNKNTIGSSLETLLNSYTLEFEDRKVRVDLLDNNIIKVYDQHYSNQKLNCTIGFDSNFTNLPSSSINPLSKYIISILKKHIYNTFAFSINIDRVISGINVERLENILDTYRDDSSDEIMKERLDDIRVSIMVYSHDTLKEILLFAV